MIGAAERAPMHARIFDHVELFRAVADSGARALLIGRQALIALGLPVNTRDYDFWIDGADAERLNAAVAPLGLVATHTPAEARATGRYVLENSEHVDVLVARGVSTVEGTMVCFDDVWPRRQLVEVAPGVGVAIPSLDDLILTKRFGARPRDAEDIRLLEVLRSKAGS
jgi:hypothetical protein